MRSELINAEALKGIDVEARIQIANRVGRLIMHADSSADREAANELAYLLVMDVSVSVRSALGGAVANCQFLPKEICERFASDIGEVSVPFLVASEALDDDFIETIVRDCCPVGDDEGKQQAIAKRKNLSEAIAYAICDVGSEAAVDSLMDNETANVSERAAERVINRFPENQPLLEKLASRADFSITLAEAIIFKISVQYGQLLSEKLGLASDYNSYLISLAQRQVFTNTLNAAPEKELENYLKQLHAAGGLTSDVLLGYLQNNNLRIFIASLAVLNGKKANIVEHLIGHHNRAAADRLLKQAGLANSVIGVLLIAYDRLFEGD